MGAANVNAAHLMWGQLDDGPFRVLTAMAVRALDQDKDGRPARRWFGGQDDLASMVKQTKRDGTPRPFASRVKAAYDHLAVLVECRVVRCIVRGGYGRRAEYALNLDPLNPWPTNASDKAQCAAQPQTAVCGSAADRVCGSAACTVCGSATPPGEQQENARKNDQENMHSGEHVQSANPEPVENAGWADVELIGEDDAAAAEHYPAAAAHLERAIGTAAAGAQLAARIEHDPTLTMTAAVLRLAIEHGYEPSVTPGNLRV